MKHSLPTPTEVQKALTLLQSAFATLEALVPAPNARPFKEGIVVRYEKPSLQIAIVQKSAILLSGLRASWVLLNEGQIYEFGVLRRTLDDCTQDIDFLALAIIEGEITSLHKEYLEWFFFDDFGKTDEELRIAPGEVLRKKIRARIANSSIAGPDPSRFIEAMLKLQRGYSKFVHGSSLAAMELVGGDPPKHWIAGARPRIAENIHDFSNYLYRAILALAFSANVLGQRELFQELRHFSAEFAKARGTEFG